MKPKLKQNMYVRDIKDEIAVYDEHTGHVHFLNQTAAFILELCNGTNTKNDIVAKMEEKYEVANEVAEKDVEDVLKNLRENNMLEEIIVN